MSDPSGPADVPQEATTAAPPSDLHRPLWLAALAGLGLVAAARGVSFWANHGRIAGDQMLPDLLYLVGYVGFAAALGLVSALSRSLSPGARVGLLIGAAYFLFTGSAL